MFDAFIARAPILPASAIRLRVLIDAIARSENA